MIIIKTPAPGVPAWGERLADPLVMLRAELMELQQHLEIEDDRTPTVRVQFGTGLVAAAFGCRIIIHENSQASCGEPILQRAEDVHELQAPSLEAGWFGKLAEWAEIWRNHLPEDVHIQHSDIQSAFNTAHLVRGSGIMMDFYDNPDELGLLLGRITDYMIAITNHLKSQISDDREWFFDWGALWKGFARISNCSMRMISPKLYREHVLPRDARFYENIGGGRMHYCGISGEVIDDFMKIPLLTGLDLNFRLHDFYATCERAPKSLVLIPSGAFAPDSPEIQRMLAGDWPQKRNIIVVAKVASIDEGKRLLNNLRNSIPY